MVLGVLMILMGIFFVGLMPWFTQREFRFHKRPVTGLVGAPVLGALFGIGWTPCIGPTLTSVNALAADQASAGRGALLTAAYCLGLGLPFILAAVAFRKALGAFGWVKRHYAWVMRIGGGMMVATGLLLLTGAWDSIVQEMQGWSEGFHGGDLIHEQDRHPRAADAAARRRPARSSPPRPVRNSSPAPRSRPSAGCAGSGGS